jgi:DNA-binding NarL/FixJ family response regulator
MPHSNLERPGNPTRVAVVAAHHICRVGVTELVQSVPEFEIVAQGASGTDAIAIARKTQPNVLILDLPGAGTEAIIRKVREANAGTKIIILTTQDDAELLRSFVAAGACGYLLKSADSVELTAAIKAASRDEDNVLVSVSRATVVGLSQPPYLQGDVLSAKELEVLALLIEGHSNRDIATKLYISSGTVKRHLTKIYAKLGASSRVDAVRKAARLSQHQTRDQASERF